jgi:hypothetical protein
MRNVYTDDIWLKPLKGKRWMVVKPIMVRLSNGETITIPVGFITDLSSVPQPFWSIFTPYGDFVLAAIVHDYLYVEKYKGDRAFCDKEMLIISSAINNSNCLKIVDNNIRYAMVRAFGWYYWCCVDL